MLEVYDMVSVDEVIFCLLLFIKRGTIYLLSCLTKILNVMANCAVGCVEILGKMLNLY